MVSPERRELRVEHLSFTYPGMSEPSLHSTSFSAAPGELVACIGVSGSGKSTLLGLITGLLSPQSGRVLYGESEVASIAPAQRRIGYIPQETGIYSRLTVYQNVYLPLRSRGLRGAEARSVAEATIERFGLSRFARRSASALSGGERQRVALARVLAWRPTMLCLDEPLSSVDAVARPEILRLISTAHKELGAITVYVTHMSAESLSISTRVLVLDRGRQVQFGPPDEVYRRPAHIETARLVSDGPLILVPVEKVSKVSGDRYRLLVQGIEILATLDEHVYDPFPVNLETAIVAFRREHFCLAKESTPAAPLTVTIDNSSFHGSRFLASSSSWLPGLSFWSDEKLPPASRVNLKPTSLPLSVFDRRTGMALIALRMEALHDTRGFSAMD